MASHLARVLVTGASAGIGLALVKRLASQGYKVFGCAPARKVQPIKDIQCPNDNKVHDIVCDITDEVQVKDMFDEINKTAGGLDICVNNVGISYNESLLHGSPEKWREIFEANVIGPCMVSQNAVKSMVKGGRDDCIILNVNSIRGMAAPKYSSPSVSVYIGTKHAITGISSALRGELSLAGLGEKIRVMQVSPGMVETNFVVSYAGEEVSKAGYAETVPLKADDIVDSIMHALKSPRHATIVDQIVWPTKVLNDIDAI